MKSGGSYTEYFYDNSGAMEYEFRYNSSGTLTRVLKYFYDSNGEIQFLLSKADNFKNQEAYNLYCYVRDGLGNITGLIRVKSQSGSSTVQDKTLVAEYTYDSYGQIISATRPSGVTDDIYQINPIRYKGYYYDADTGWYNLKTRYYDPVIARFINADDVSLIAESPEDLTDKNLYSYCDNNPITRSDNDGDCWHILIGGVIGAAYEVVSQIAEYGHVKSWQSVGIAAAAGGLTACIGPAAGVAIVSGMGSTVAELTKGKSVKESIISGVVSGGIAGTTGKIFKSLLNTGAKNSEKAISKFKDSLNIKKSFVKIGSWCKNAFRRDSHKAVSVFMTSFHGGKVNFIYNAVRSSYSKH